VLRWRLAVLVLLAALCASATFCFSRDPAPSSGLAARSNLRTSDFEPSTTSGLGETGRSDDTGRIAVVNRTDRESGDLVVSVLDATTDSPLPGAMVYGSPVSAPQKLLPENFLSSTDAGGLAVVPRADARGFGALWAVMEGYEATGLPVGDDGADAVIALRLKKSVGTVSVICRDPTGTPLKDVRVFLTECGDRVDYDRLAHAVRDGSVSVGRLATLRTGVSDGEGLVRLTGLRLGTWYAAAALPGYWTETGLVPITVGEQESACEVFMLPIVVWGARVVGDRVVESSAFPHPSWRASAKDPWFSSLTFDLHERFPGSMFSVFPVRNIEAALSGTMRFDVVLERNGRVSFEVVPQRLATFVGPQPFEFGGGPPLSAMTRVDVSLEDADGRVPEFDGYSLTRRGTGPRTRRLVPDRGTCSVLAEPGEYRVLSHIRGAPDAFGETTILAGGETVAVQLRLPFRVELVEFELDWPANDRGGDAWLDVRVDDGAEFQVFFYERRPRRWMRCGEELRIRPRGLRVREEEIRVAFAELPRRGGRSCLLRVVVSPKES
jgi:hypothetical protein